MTNLKGGVVDIYAIENGEVWFRWNGVDMVADIDDWVVNPVVIKGTAAGCEVDVKFSDYKGLQQAINKWCEL